jgi:hypothetical protein
VINEKRSGQVISEGIRFDVANGCLPGHLFFFFLNCVWEVENDLRLALGGSRRDLLRRHLRVTHVIIRFNYVTYSVCISTFDHVAGRSSILTV